ncbi:MULTISPECIES: hypothetical protein [unclassified Bacillus (in: firmicutes)]|uniref:hypothetical protein n=1 Tax=unclassified Bacillus (in: firmicutes) TaxID=185979 RepID=UPI0008E8FE1B|nr:MULTISPECIES: hypothetical protein [unclassified Bacillus (in: firmicutes)]SFA70289.1 hypothetical protein SAMN02799634_101100 [Bacillus sp. UNCCL13]SFQ59883.1 hypothetical protein SAMN04488577_0384 [Bacillus sp. cl95]
MKRRFILLLITTTILLISTVFGYNLLNYPIKEKGFTKMTIYLNGDKEGPYIITDKKVIKNVIKTINSSPKRDISKIIFEKGPDGRIIFEGKNTDYEVKVFSDGGNIVTEKYYILTDFNLGEIKNKD